MIDIRWASKENTSVRYWAGSGEWQQVKEEAAVWETTTTAAAAAAGATATAWDSAAFRWERHAQEGDARAGRQQVGSGE